MKSRIVIDFKNLGTKEILDNRIWKIYDFYRFQISKTNVDFRNLGQV